jgi:hypothetical protein
LVIGTALTAIGWLGWDDFQTYAGRYGLAALGIVILSVCLVMLIKHLMANILIRLRRLPYPKSDGQQGERQFISVVESRLGTWFFSFALWSSIFWFFGVLGVASAAVAAANEKTRWIAVVSSVSVAVIGFLNPQREANRYIRAWRILDDAFLLYNYAGGNTDVLITAIRRGEAILGESEGLPNGTESSSEGGTRPT